MSIEDRHANLVRIVDRVVDRAIMSSDNPFYVRVLETDMNDLIRFVNSDEAIQAVQDAPEISETRMRLVTAALQSGVNGEQAVDAADRAIHRMKRWPDGTVDTETVRKLREEPCPVK